MSKEVSIKDEKQNFWQRFQSNKKEKPSVQVVSIRSLVIKHLNISFSKMFV